MENVFERIEMKNITLIFGIFLIIATAVLGYSISIEETYSGFTNSQTCYAHGNHVFLLDHYRVYSFNPSTGAFVDTLNLGEYVRSIDIEGSVAVVMGITKLYLIDVSDPTSMTLLDDLSVGMGSMGWDAVIDGSMVYCAVQNRAIVAEITGTSLTMRGAFYPYGSFPMVRCIEINGETMYVGDANSGIYAVDVSNPATPSIRMSASTPGSKIDLEVLPGDKLIVADGAYVGIDSTSVRIFDIPTPTTMTEIGAWVQFGGDAIEVNTPSPYNRVALADGEGGVKIIDISDPDDPYLVAHQATTDLINGIYVSNDTLYVAGMSNFYIMTTDAFGSDSDTVVTHVPASVDSVWPEDLIISSCAPYFDWFYTAGSLPIDPGSAIIEINGATFTGYDTEVSIGGGIISIDMEGYPYLSHDTVYAELTYLSDTAGSTAVGIGLSSLIVLDLDPPALTDVSPMPGDSVHRDSVAVSGNIADSGPASLDESGFRVIINSISYSPSGIYLDFIPPAFICTPMGSFSPGNEVEVCVTAEDMPDECPSNELDTCWIFFIRTTGIAESGLPDNVSLSASPNPFNSATTLTIGSLPEGESRLEIFDIHGRMVDVIEKSKFVNNRAVWEPSAEIGSGLYFAGFPGGEMIRVVFLK